MSRPFVVRVGDLLRDPGSRRDVDLAAVVDDFAGSGSTVVPGTAVIVTGVAESMPGGLVITGDVRADWVGDCRRCLEPTSGQLDLPFREAFQRNPIDEDVLPIDDEDLLDLEPLVRELVLSALPLAPLCRVDCPGPDPERFPTGPPEEDDGPPIDPRWGPLADLEFD